MGKKSGAMKFIESNYEIMGMNMDNSFEKIKVILDTYKEVNWRDLGEVEIIDISDYEDFYGDDRFAFLLNYVSENEIAEFKRRARSAMMTTKMMDLVKQSIRKVKEYPRQGEMYYKILDLKYLNFFSYCEDEILDEINVDRSTYFRKKKEAMYLLGYVLFGLILPRYVMKAVSA